MARTYENARDLAHNPEDLDHAKIAALWRTGCIIRAALLPKIKAAFERDAELSSLLLGLFFVEAIKAAQTAWRRVVTLGVKSGIPIPAMSSALAYYDGYRTARLPANLLQAQRDYFGAHQCQRIDKPRGEFFHTDWS